MINPLKQLRAFRAWRRLNELSHAEADLWYAIYGVFCDAYFVSDTLTIANKTLIAEADLTDKSQLSKLRKNLCGKGLIEYTPGEVGHAGVYRLICLYEEKSIDFNTEKYTGFYTVNKKENIKEIKNRDIYSDTKEDFAKVERAAKSFNEICTSLKPVTKLTAKRRTSVRARLVSYSIEQLEDAFKKTEESDFLCGRRGGWSASFDWILANDDNVLRILEGNYDNRARRGGMPEPEPDSCMASTGEVSEIEQRFMQMYM